MIFRSALVVHLSPLLKASHISVPLHSLSSALVRPVAVRHAGLTEDVFRLLKTLFAVPEVVCRVRDSLLLHSIHSDLLELAPPSGSADAARQLLQRPQFLQYVVDMVHVVGNRRDDFESFVRSASESSLASPAARSSGLSTAASSVSFARQLVHIARALCLDSGAAGAAGAAAVAVHADLTDCVFALLFESVRALRREPQRFEADIAAVSGLLRAALFGPGVARRVRAAAAMQFLRVLLAGTTCDP